MCDSEDLGAAIVTSRDKLLLLARLQSKIERWDDLVNTMTEVIKQDSKLTLDERNLFALGCKNLVAKYRGSRQSLLRTELVREEKLKLLGETPTYLITTSTSDINKSSSSSSASNNDSEPNNFKLVASNDAGSMKKYAHNAGGIANDPHKCSGGSGNSSNNGCVKLLQEEDDGGDACHDVESPRYSGVYLEAIRGYRHNIESELGRICTVITNIIGDLLISNDRTPEELLFYLKMRADYNRYVCEMQDIDESGARSKAQLTLEYYEEALAIAAKNKISIVSPLRLGLCFNYSVFCDEILKNRQKALDFAAEVLEDAISHMDEASEDDNNEIILILRLLQSNVTHWKDTDEDDKSTGLKRYESSS